jgi:eukaryotic-like serine/threonine-protein kinase
MMSQAVVPSLPWKVGRYDVVGPLATGGMAEILLGRIVGPSGFQRPVVIKRILPHLARDKGFMEMFLDEARIVAGVRHPNVVQVHELGHEADELFLVMEYLEGESAAGLAKRLRAHDEPLDYSLAAYIVAEACAGLHAAHELVDANGQKQNVVHRDVSPQNVFITYSGEVKVLDFGIAVAADRVTRTEAGTFKGKFEYSSPEQCKGQRLDRRSDVFALGILLFELATGKRLFKRMGQLATLRAICEEPIIRPTELLPDFPPALESIIMRALERDRDKRYQTALEMRRELLSALRTLTTDVAPEERLATAMNRLFSDRVLEKSAMLRRVEAGSVVDDIPAPETDTSIEIPLAVDFRSVPPPPGEGVSGTQRLPATDLRASLTGNEAFSEPRGELSPIATGRPSRIVIGAGIGALLLFSVVGLAVCSRPPATKELPIARVPVEAPATATVDPTLSLPAAAATPAPPSDVVIRIETSPSKAHVFVAGEDRGTSPVELRLARGTDVTEVEIRRDGYVTQVEKVTPETDQKLKLTLVAAAAPGRPAAPKPSAAASGNAYRRFD